MPEQNSNKFTCKLTICSEFATPEGRDAFLDFLLKYGHGSDFPRMSESWEKSRHLLGDDPGIVSEAEDCAAREREWMENHKE